MDARYSGVVQTTPLRKGAKWVASRDSFPTSVQAVFGYYADSGRFDYSALKLKRYVEETSEKIVSSVFADIETALEQEFQLEHVEFEYDTKLTLPAELTLGYIYRQVLSESSDEFNPITRKAKPELFEYTRVIYDKKRERRRNERLADEAESLIQRVDHAEAITALIIEALLEGDVRDALNDEEYSDFEVNFAVEAEADQRRVVQTAQEVLQESVEERFDTFPPRVKDAYEEAVEVSERHQTKDPQFRQILKDLKTDESGAQQRLETEYKFASFDSPPDMFGPGELDLPYLKSQYRRVGVIYDGMIEMYRGAGFTINASFKKSIVLAIIGAQIWLDDVDDFHEDRAHDQLTPVTAEYVLHEDQSEAYANVVTTTERYLNLAKRYATESGTTLTGIAVEYIYQSGDPSVLPSEPK